jgi:hypothetical protein
MLDADAAMVKDAPRCLLQAESGACEEHGGTSQSNSRVVDETDELEGNLDFGCAGGSASW